VPTATQPAAITNSIASLPSEAETIEAIATPLIMHTSEQSQSMDPMRASAAELTSRCLRASHPAK
jgi:hypothetical protein